MKPFISLVVATLNSSGTLQRLLDSLCLQKYEPFELVLQDGMSGDDTVALVESYRNRIPSISLESVSDSGIYDAWNKALQRTKGEWIVFLGADDILLGPDALADLAHVLARQEDTLQYLSCPVILTGPDGTFIERVAPAFETRRSLVRGMCLPHQGLVHRKELFLNNGFETGYRIAGDFEFLCRTVAEDAVAFHSRPFAAMSVGGLSSDFRTMVQRDVEFLRIIRTYFPGERPLKVFVRILKTWSCVQVARFLGNGAGALLADAMRIVRRKPRVWTMKGDGPKVFIESCGNCSSNRDGRKKVSLVVATWKRKDELQRLLQSLSEQTFQDFEVLLADQNPEGYLDDTLSPFPGMDIKTTPVPPKGVSAARNAVLEHASGDIIAFPDDDCYYAHDVLEQVVRYFHLFPEYGAVLGRWVVPDSDDADGGRAGGSEDMDGSSVVTRYSVFRRAGTLVQFYRRQAVSEVGLFDEKLGPGTGLPWGCGEDTDYLLRAWKRYPVARCPSIHVYHHETKLEDAGSRGKARSYGMGRMYLLKKHGMPRWFCLANLLHPLAGVLKDAATFRFRSSSFRFAMFMGRVRGWWALRKG